RILSLQPPNYLRDYPRRDALATGFVLRVAILSTRSSATPGRRASEGVPGPMPSLARRFGKKRLVADADELPGPLCPDSRPRPTPLRRHGPLPGPGLAVRRHGHRLRPPRLPRRRSERCQRRARAEPSGDGRHHGCLLPHLRPLPVAGGVAGAALG